MGTITATQDTAAQLSVIVTRADGTVEDHGIVAFYHPSRWRRLMFRLTGKGL